MYIPSLYLMNSMFIVSKILQTFVCHSLLLTSQKVVVYIEVFRRNKLFIFTSCLLKIYFKKVHFTLLFLKSTPIQESCNYK